MSLSAKQIKLLEKIIAAATELLKSAKTSEKAAGNVAAPRKRRAGQELAAFRKMLAVERANGASVAELAKTHGVSSAYIYQIPAAKRSSSKKAAKKPASKNVSRTKTQAGKRASKNASRKSAKSMAKAVLAPQVFSSETQR
jgi:hypothetical protein